MKGYLEFLALSLIQKQNISGYKIIKSIGSALGKDPSAGSIYPILLKLSKEGLLSVKQQGREKEYSITKKGIERISDTEQVQRDSFERMHKLICTGTGKIHEDSFHSSINSMLKTLHKVKSDSKKEALEIVKNAESRLRRLT